jgi:hypothetical protein
MFDCSHGWKPNKSATQITEDITLIHPRSSLNPLLTKHPNKTKPKKASLMKTKKLFSITSAIAGVLLVGSTVGAFAQTSLYVDNPGFELPATGKISAGFDVSTNDVPGWMDAGVNSEAGIEAAGWGNSGSYSAYCLGGVPGAYQITTNLMEWGKKYTLTWSMAIDYIDSSSSQTVSILSADATNTPYASCTVGAVFSQPISGNFTYHGSWSPHSLTFISGNAQVGKYIGMGFRCGTQWISFDDFALTVEDASLAELLPNITTEPVGVSVYEGSPVVVTVAATGPDLTYQWQAGVQGSGIYTNLPGATSATLSYSWATAANTADYIVIITNTAGSATSTVASVTVTPATYANGLFNGDFELPALGGITAGFDEAGKDIPGWKNAGPNQNDSGMEGAGSGHTGSYAAKTQKGQSGAYQITTNVMQLGDSITMTWWEKNAWQGLTAKVSLLSASSQQEAFGSTTTLASQTNVLVHNDYAWYPRSMTYTAGAGDVGKLLGVFLGTVDITTGGWGDFDDFSITITPAAAAPIIVTQPASQTVWLASTATITVAAGGSGLSYQWQAGAVGSGIYTNISNGGQFSGANSNIMTIANVSVGNALDYIVIVTNTGGSVTSSPAATLTVNTAAPNIGPISSKTVFQYDTTTLSPAYADGATAYQWQAGAVGSGIYTNLSNNGHFSGVNTATLTITNAAPADGLDYVLIASNAGGSSTNGPATLTVTPLIYLENFTANGPTISGLGWLCDARSGLYDTSGNDGTRLIAFDSATGPQAFYTTTKLDTGSTGPAFPVIKLAGVTNLTFSVDVASDWQPANTHMYWAVQMNGSQWYVTASEIDQATGGGLSPRTLAVDTNAYAWNQLTVSSTGGTNTASVPLVGSAATNDLTGYVTGIGFVTSSTGSSFVTFDNLTITGEGFTVLPGLSIAPSGSNVSLTWGYGTLVESTNANGPWTPVIGTSPLMVSPTGGSHFYGLQLP